MKKQLPDELITWLVRQARVMFGLRRYLKGPSRPSGKFNIEQE